MRGKSGREREHRERRFAVLGNNNLLGFIGTLSRFQPSLGASHQDLGSNFILEATVKEFLEKVSYMPSVMKDNCSNEVINSSIVLDCFNLVKHPKECVSMSK
jgi:hypothetical protein